MHPGLLVSLEALNQRAASERGCQMSAILILVENKGLKRSGKILSTKEEFVFLSIEN
jgi:hypothetical protein